MDENSKIGEAGPEAGTGIPEDAKKPPDFMTPDEWPLTVAATWIAWRDRQRTARAYDPWRRAHGLPPATSVGDLVEEASLGMFRAQDKKPPVERWPENDVFRAELIDAFDKLIKSLFDGNVKSYWKKSGNNPSNIVPSECWAGLSSSSFLRSEGLWHVGRQDIASSELYTSLLRGWGGNRLGEYENVFVRKDAILAIYPSFDDVVPSTEALAETPEAGRISPTAQDAAPAPSSQIHRTKDELEQAYIDRTKNWPHSRPPNEADDWNFLKSLSPDLPRKRAREIRRDKAPPEWKKSGRRRRN